MLGKPTVGDGKGFYFSLRRSTAASAPTILASSPFTYSRLCSGRITP